MNLQTSHFLWVWLYRTGNSLLGARRLQYKPTEASHNIGSSHGLKSECHKCAYRYAQSKACLQVGLAETMKLAFELSPPL